MRAAADAMPMPVWTTTTSPPGDRPVDDGQRGGAGARGPGHAPDEALALLRERER